MDGIGYTPGSGSQVAVEMVDGKMVQIVKLSSSNGWSYAGPEGGITNSAEVVLMTAQGADKRVAITGLQFHNASAAASEIVLKSGTTIIWRGWAPNVMGMMQNVPFCLKAAAGQPIKFQVLTDGTTTRVSAQGFVEAA